MRVLYENKLALSSALEEVEGDAGRCSTFQFCGCFLPPQCVVVVLTSTLTASPNPLRVHGRSPHAAGKPSGSFFLTPLLSVFCFDARGGHVRLEG